MKTKLLLLILLSLAGCVTAGPRRWFSGSCIGEGVCGDGGLCVDGQCARSCTTTTECDDGICVQKHCLPPARACQTSLCNDGNTCTDDLCNTQTGACRHDPGSGPCDDKNQCTIGDECVLIGDVAMCKAAPKCDDGDPSTSDSCDSASGACTHTSK